MKCERCKTGKLEKTVAPDTVEVGKRVFTAKVPALRCRECGEVYSDGPSLERFELRAAVQLAMASEATGEVMRFMRKVAGLQALELAELLAVTPVFAPHPRIIERAQWRGALKAQLTAAGDKGIVDGMQSYFAKAARLAK